MEYWQFWKGLFRFPNDNCSKRNRRLVVLASGYYLISFACMPIQLAIGHSNDVDEFATGTDEAEHK